MSFDANSEVPPRSLAEQRRMSVLPQFMPNRKLAITRDDCANQRQAAAGELYSRLRSDTCWTALSQMCEPGDYVVPVSALAGEA
jgi:hypothetical protein